ncbi:MAG: LytTR family DNA-binding domain-containing protein [Bacteroidota bacterium]
MDTTAFIVDDESKSRNTLRNLVNRYCPEVSILGEAGTIMDAVSHLNIQQPDFVFLDIHLPRQDGFKLFDYFPKPEFEVIFTTAYSQYTLNALRMSAVDYLLKPINKDDLIGAVQKAIDRRKRQTLIQNFHMLKNNLRSDLQKIALPNSNGFEYVNIKDIIRCSANRNYTYFHLVNDRNILVSKNLKTYEDILCNFNFMRANRSNIVNLHYVKAYSRSNGGELIMEDDSTISLSPAMKDELLERLNS